MTIRPYPLLSQSLRALAALVAGLCLAAAAPAREDAAEDPPARVGRVALLDGAVELSRGPGAPWDPARVNEPVTAQTALWVPPGSRAELRIGSTSVRLSGNTQAVFSQLDDHGVVIDVAQGSVRARLRSLPEGDAFVLAADGSRAEARTTGDFRLDHDPDLGATTLGVRDGTLGLVTPRRSATLEAGQQAHVERGGARLQLADLDAADDFDRWAEARDRRQDQLASARYVSPEMTGVEALDEHGRWNVDATLGPVWYPLALPVGWAPYRVGHWGWVAPWGWTWIDHAPWGFAPFHYGRWARVGGHWGWVPGRYVARPVWAPALVGFVGRGSVSIGIGIGIGSVRPSGWFPLGPHEVYRPPYRYSPRYERRVNVIVDQALPLAPTHGVHERPHPSGQHHAHRQQALTLSSDEQFRAPSRRSHERHDARQDQGRGEPRRERRAEPQRTEPRHAWPQHAVPQRAQPQGSEPQHAEPRHDPRRELRPRQGAAPISAREERTGSRSERQAPRVPQSAELVRVPTQAVRPAGQPAHPAATPALPATRVLPPDAYPSPRQSRVLPATNPQPWPSARPPQRQGVVPVRAERRNEPGRRPPGG